MFRLSLTIKIFSFILKACYIKKNLNSIQPAKLLFYSIYMLKLFGKKNQTSLWLNKISRFVNFMLLKDGIKLYCLRVKAKLFSMFRSLQEKRKKLDCINVILL